MPCTNGQLEPTQGGSSISSFAPADTMLGCAGSIAKPGSFCLFGGNGDAGLPTVTDDSDAACAAGAPSAIIAQAVSTAKVDAVTRLLRMALPPMGVAISTSHSLAAGP